MTEINELDRRVLGAMDGRDRVRLLLKDVGLGLQEFAEKHNLWVQQVSMCLSGAREYPDIRKALAKELKLSRETLDALLDGKAA